MLLGWGCNQACNSKNLLIISCIMGYLGQVSKETALLRHVKSELGLTNSIFTNLCRAGPSRLADTITKQPHTLHNSICNDFHVQTHCNNATLCQRNLWQSFWNTSMFYRITPCLISIVFSPVFNLV